MRRWPLRVIAASIALVLGLWEPAAGQVVSGPAEAKAAPTCPPRPYRWQEDCSNLAGLDLRGLAALRYQPLSDRGDVWLTLGGEARVRMDLLNDVDFGIDDGPGYTQFGGRLTGNADLRTRAGPRLFVQMAVVQQTGRRPAPKPQDESAIDVTQVFVDAPFRLAGVSGLVRLGRQELDLSGNRLVTTRDGATIRRAFEGAKLDLNLQGAKLSLVSARPMDLRDKAFADRADRAELFNAVSLDLPPTLSPGGQATLYYLDRQREDARWLRAEGKERRYSIGARYLGHVADWRVESQVTWQTGKSAGQPVQAYGAALSLDQEFSPERPVVLGIDLVAASGDRRGTRQIETFDPVYPNNFGLSDAPLFYQTNYVFGGGSLSTRWGGATWTAGANLLVRHSTTDSVYANSRPIPGTDNPRRQTSLLPQISVRRPFSDRSEIYASLVRAQALGGLRAAGGHNAIYSRLQITTRF